MNKQNKNNHDTKEKTKSGNSDSARKLDELEKASDKERTRKPGSQSNSSDQKNNGRGGGR